LAACLLVASVPSTPAGSGSGALQYAMPDLTTFVPERFSGWDVIYLGWATARQCQMPDRPIDRPSESRMTSIRLGVTVTGLYGLITMGLMVVFLRGPG
jgi:hypothetical protein